MPERTGVHCLYDRFAAAVCRQITKSPAVASGLTASPRSPRNQYPARRIRYSARAAPNWAQSRAARLRWRRHCSFDYLVGAGEDRLRDRQAERLGGLEVDDQLEL